MRWITVIGGLFVFWLSETAWAQTTVTIHLVETQVKAQASWFFTAMRVPEQTAGCLLAGPPDGPGDECGTEAARRATAFERKRLTEGFEYLAPRQWSEIAAVRKRLIWLPDEAVDTYASTVKALQSTTFAPCTPFNKQIRECTSVIQIRAEPSERGADLPTVVGVGLALSRAFDGPGLGRQLEADWEPMVVSFRSRRYVRVAVRDWVLASQTEKNPIPFNDDTAMVFNYELSSTDKAAIQSPARLSELLNSLKTQTELEPLALRAGRANASNEIFAGTDRRFSDKLKVYEKFTVSLLTEPTLYPLRGAEDKLGVKITGRLTVWISEEKTNDRVKWHQATSEQFKEYQSDLRDTVQHGTKAACAIFGTAPGGTSFNYELGASAEITCTNPRKD